MDTTILDLKTLMTLYKRYCKQNDHDYETLNMLDMLIWLREYGCHVTDFKLESVPEWKDSDRKTEFILKFL